MTVSRVDRQSINDSLRYEVLGLMRRRQGVSVGELVDIDGVNSERQARALVRSLKERGFKVTRTKEGRDTIYKSPRPPDLMSMALEGEIPHTGMKHYRVQPTSNCGGYIRTVGRGFQCLACQMSWSETTFDKVVREMKPGV